MTSNVAGLIREGVAAFKGGRKEDAQKMLRRAAELDPQNEEAWLWLSAVVDSLENQKICLENVLAVNPNNARARQGLEMVNRQLANQAQAAPPPAAAQTMPSISPFDLNAPVSSRDAYAPDPFAAAPASDDPFASASFTDPFGPAPTGGTAFHGSGQDVQLPSADQYDDWVQGLNLGGSGASAPARDDVASSPFDVGGGPFQQPDMAASPPASFDPFDASAPPPPSMPFADMVSPGAEVAKGYSAPLPAPVKPIKKEEAEAYDTEGAFGDFDYYKEAEGGEFSSASPFGELEAEAATDYEQAEDLRQFFDYLPESIKASHLPDQIPNYPRGLMIGLAVVSGGVVLSLAVTVILLLTG